MDHVIKGPLRVVDLPLSDPASGTLGEDCKISEDTANKNNGLKTEINRSRQRKRTERLATDYLDLNLSLPPGKRLKALAQIRKATQPKREAKRIIEWNNSRGLSAGGEAVDLSSAQEVVAKLIRRDGGIWQPQARLVRLLEENILSGMTRMQFAKAAAVILSMSQVLPKSFLKAEGGPD